MVSEKHLMQTIQDPNLYWIFPFSVSFPRFRKTSHSFCYDALLHFVCTQDVPPRSALNIMKLSPCVVACGALTKCFSFLNICDMLSLRSSSD